MAHTNIRTEKGFTLFEVIVTLTVAAILASFLVYLYGNSDYKKFRPYQTGP